ncbi:MAG: D-Ala-D-Ala carboxypeptidase family metallohydrolase [Myxococcota bacterium]
MTGWPPNWTLAELTRTSTGLPNEPAARHVERLRRGAWTVLQPWRDEVGALFATSGFRSDAVNAKVGGVPTSHHRDGRAADLIPLDTTKGDAWRRLVAMIELGLVPVDEAIVYEAKPHIHVSWPLHEDDTPDRELLVDVGGGRTVPWSEYRGPLRPDPVPPAPLEPTPRQEPAMSIVTIKLTQAQREALRQRALDQLTAARDKAFAQFIDGQITLDELEDSTSSLLRGASRVGEQLIDDAIRLPEPFESLADQGVTFVFDLARNRLDGLVGKVVRWADDQIGPNPRRLLRRIDELERDDLEDGIIGDDKPQRMYRLAERLVRKFPDSADAGGVSFDADRQLYLDGEPWGTPPDGFVLRSA